MTAQDRRNAPAAPEIARVGNATMNLTDGVLVIRLEVTGAPNTNNGPAVITARNCDAIGLSPRQFRDLIKARVIPGGPLPRSRVIAAALDDVLAAVRAAAAADARAPAAPTSSMPDADAVLDAAGVARSGPK